MRKSTRFARLSLEILEDRTVPAGNVTVNSFPGLIQILGDIRDNKVEIAPGTAVNQFVIRGLNGTTVNNNASVAYTLPAGLPNFNIDLKQGNDQAVFTNRSETNANWPIFTVPQDPNAPLVVHGSLIFNGGDGKDIFNARNVNVTASMVILTTGASDDFVVMESVNIARDLTISTAAGADELFLQSVKVTGNTVASTGLGKDEVGLFGCTLNGYTSINTGADDDEAWIEGNTFQRQLIVALGNSAHDELTDNVAGINTLNGSIETYHAHEDLEHLSAVHFTYSGAEGPDEWGHLTPAWLLTSAGRMQTPIDIQTASAIPTALPSLNPSYLANTNIPFVHNGHTIQVNLPAGSTLTVNGTVYQLLQFHFHFGSEHYINGVAYPLELHFVHRNAAGQLLVIGVFITAGGPNNSAYDPLIDNLPQNDGVHNNKTIPGPFSAADLLPGNLHNFYAYSGSLTTPPGTEFVSWAVLSTTVQVSDAQYAAIMAAIGDANARPIQPQNDRPVLVNT